MNVKFQRYNGTSWENLNIRTNWSSIQDKPTTFTPTAHTHSINSVNNKIGIKNQLVNKANYPAASSINNVNITPNTNTGEITVVVGTGGASGNFDYQVNGFMQTLNSSHKFLLIGCASGGANTSYELVLYSPSDFQLHDIGNGSIGNLTSGVNYTLYISIYSGCPAGTYKFKPQLIDLTEWCGSGNEPTSANEAIMIIGNGWTNKVDLGTLTWNYNSTYPNIFFAQINNMKSINDNIGILNNKYNYGGYATLASMTTDKTIYNNATYIYIKDTSYTNVTTFKNSLNGVYLEYEVKNKPFIPYCNDICYFNQNVGSKSFIEDGVQLINKYVPLTRTINGKTLAENITLTMADIDSNYAPSKIKNDYYELEFEANGSNLYISNILSHTTTPLLNIATSSTLGLVKIGSGLSINSLGVLSTVGGTGGLTQTSLFNGNQAIGGGGNYTVSGLANAMSSNSYYFITIQILDGGDRQKVFFVDVSMLLSEGFQYLENNDLKISSGGVISAAADYTLLKINGY